MNKLIIAVFVALVGYVSAGGYGASSYGFDTLGPLGKASVQVQHDNFIHNYGVNQLHPGGQSYISRSGNAAGLIAPIAAAPLAYGHAGLGHAGLGYGGLGYAGAGYLGAY